MYVLMMLWWMQWCWFGTIWLSFDRELPRTCTEGEIVTCAITWGMWCIDDGMWDSRLLWIVTTQQHDEQPNNRQPTTSAHTPSTPLVLMHHSPHPFRFHDYQQQQSHNQHMNHHATTTTTTPTPTILTSITLIWSTGWMLHEPLFLIPASAPRSGP